MKNFTQNYPMSHLQQCEKKITYIGGLIVVRNIEGIVQKLSK